MPEVYTTARYDELEALLSRNPDMERNASKGQLNVLGRFHGDGRSAYAS